MAMCELMGVIGDSGISYCTIPAIDRKSQDGICDVCKANMNIDEALASEINKLQKRIFILEKKDDRKTEIEKAIQDINGLLLDFGEAVSSLRNTRELLYSFTEKEPEDEK